MRKPWVPLVTVVGLGFSLPLTPRPALCCLAAGSPAATVLPPSPKDHRGYLFVFKVPKKEERMTSFKILAQLSSLGGRRHGTPADNTGLRERSAFKP